MTFIIGEIVSHLTDDHAAGVLGIWGPECPQPIVVLGFLHGSIQMSTEFKVKVSLLMEQ